MARVLALLACSAGACFFAPERPSDGQMATGDARNDGASGPRVDGAVQDGILTSDCASLYSDDFTNGLVGACGAWGTEYSTGATTERDNGALVVELGSGDGHGGCFVSEHNITNGVSIRVDLSYVTGPNTEFELSLTAPMESPATTSLIVGHDGSRRTVRLEKAGVNTSPVPYLGPVNTVFRIVPTATSVVASYLDAASNWMDIGHDVRDARGLGSALFQARGPGNTPVARFDDLNIYTCPPP